MKKIILFLAVAAWCVSCGTDEGNLTVTYNGLLNDTVLVEYGSFRTLVEGRRLHADRRITIDTLCLHNGRFSMQIPTDEPQLVRIRPFHYRVAATNGRVFFGDGGTVQLLLQADERVKVRLSMQRKGYLKARVKGSELNADIQFAANAYRQKRHEYESLAAQIGQLHREGQSADSLRAQLNRLKKEQWACHETYIESNPSKEASAYLLYELGGSRSLKLYRTLDKQLFVGTFRPVAELIERYEKTHTIRQAARQHLTDGKPAPDFTLRDRNGQEVTLSSLRGKWVVVYFWGSWDQRSLNGLAAMKRAYEKHKDRLEIVGVACNDLPAKWEEAIDRYALPWINVIDPYDVEPNESVCLRFGVGLFPTKYILTPDGRIHRIAQGEHRSFYDELDRVVR